MICPALTTSTVSALLARPAAIVAATGGTLSHTAIIARELGIPCVTNVIDATATIPPGLHAEVNGTLGTIRPVPESPISAAVFANRGPRPAEERTTGVRCYLPGASSAGGPGRCAVIIDSGGPCTPEVIAALAQAGSGTGMLLTDPRSQVPPQLPGYRQYEIDHLVRLIWPTTAGRPPATLATTDMAGGILHQRPRSPHTGQALPPDILPSGLADFTRRILGICTLTASRSWPYHGGEVWELTGPDGTGYILKRHPSDRHFSRETEGLHWAQALGPQRAPRLLAADPRLRAVIMSLLPGIPLLDTGLSAADEQDACHQAGQLLRLLHSAIPPAADTRVLAQVTDRAGQLLEQVRDELTDREHTQIREQARQLRALAPRLPAGATHGDFQPRNLLWDATARRLAVIDFEKAAPAPAIRDLAHLEAGPLRDREDLRDAFYRGYGRTLSRIEHEALAALLILGSLSALAWGIPNGDTQMVACARRALSIPAPTAAAPGGQARQ